MSPRENPNAMQNPSQNSESLMVTSFALSDRGQVRSRNEDQFLSAQVGQVVKVEQTSIPRYSPAVLQCANRGHLFVIADGLGGHAGGQKASALAVHLLVRWVRDCPQLIEDGGDLTARFEEVLHDADVRIGQEAGRHPEFKGMGTTLTMAYCWDRTLWIAHVGDSRAYLFRKGRMEQLTRDHTIVQDMIRAGLLKPEEVAQHIWRHVVTNVLGGTELGVRPEVHKFDLQPEDILLLCSDGLTDLVTDEEIEEILANASDPRRASEILIAKANQRGAPDNVTVLLARFVQPVG